MAVIPTLGWPPNSSHLSPKLNLIILFKISKNEQAYKQMEPNTFAALRGLGDSGVRVLIVCEF